MSVSWSWLASVRRLIWILFAIALLSGCADDGSTAGTDLSSQAAGGPPPNLVMLNAEGMEGPAVEPSSGLAPFGAILSRTRSQNICTVTHLTYGRVVTNAHCLKESQDPRDYVLFFYDHSGRKEAAPVQRIVFLGNARQNDLAVLEISQDVDSRWDTAGLDWFPTDRFQRQRLSIRFRVHIWSYDPLAFHPDLASRYGTYGVVFNPRECSASRVLPRVVGVAVDEKGGEKEFEVRSTKNEAQLQVFLDGCDRPLVPGNSGSLLTEFRDFKLKVGVYQSGLPKPAPKPPQVPEFRYYKYTGNDGIDVRLRPEDLMGGEFFGWGTVFESVLHQRPDLFPAPPPPPQNIPWGENDQSNFGNGVSGYGS